VLWRVGFWSSAASWRGLQDAGHSTQGRSTDEVRCRCGVYSARAAPTPPTIPFCLQAADAEKGKSPSLKEPPSGAGVESGKHLDVPRAHHSGTQARSNAYFRSILHARQHRNKAALPEHLAESGDPVLPLAGGADSRAVPSHKQQVLFR
jgi:hypothetical protein